MSISYDLDCGEEVITLELLEDGTLISYGFDIESEMIAKEMGFEPHPCFEAIDKALWQAAHDENIDIVEILLATGSDVSAWDNGTLRWAASNGHSDVVELLLEHGADVHAAGDYALRWAAANGHTDTVQLLLEYGADVHAYDDEALGWARRNSRADVVKIIEDWIKDHG